MKNYRVICIITSVLLLFSGCAHKKEIKKIPSTPTTFSTAYLETSTEAEVPETIPEETTTATAETEPLTVYITNSGTKYHREDCQFLTYSKIPVNLNDLDTDFYKPCAVCCP